MELKIIKTEKPKQKPSGALGFGKYFTDHMFVMNYDDGKWHDARIQPYAPFTLEPCCSVFHYGQAVFEGTKAYKNKNGEVRLFRPRDNLLRMNESSDRICIPPIDVDFVLDALKKLVALDESWIPTDEGTSLYIRPSVIATENALGVHAAKSYIFFIILSPSGSYYAHGLEPVRLYVEENYVRAAKGGTGHHKVVGNYAASMKAGEKAAQMGYDQVMWLDAKEHKNVEEVGSMNIFFVFDNVVKTPALRGSILPGITRRSVIELLKDEGYKVEECDIAVKDVVEGAKNGKLEEVFGTGTAAVISPVGDFGYRGEDFVVGGGKMGKISRHIYDELTGIQTGRVEDRFGWVTKL
ncbi:MAG: branched-chain amino acid aminotransferase [Clostridia bacterium]|jgi:branched-chain amino acid aminotransferase|nr:branched-chain amino acid aminotransferase [Clostridia bacterium]